MKEQNRTRKEAYDAHSLKLLSYLTPEEQAQLLDATDSKQATPSLSKAQRLKRFSQEDKLSPAVMSAILSEEKKVEQEQVFFSADAF